MLKKSAIAQLLSLDHTQLSFQINISQYGANSAPNYVAIYVSDDEKVYYENGSTAVIDLFALNNNKNVTEENGLKFVLTNGAAWKPSASPAYVTLSNFKLSTDYKDVKLKIATTTGDLKGAYSTEEEIIEKLYEAGFRYLDFNMYSLNASSALMQDNWRDTALVIKAVADSLGIQFVQAHSPGYNLLAATKAEMDLVIATNIRAIEVCEVLGIKNTVVHAGYKGGLTKQQWFAENKAIYDQLLPTAERCGVNVLCENSTAKNLGNQYYINTGADMREFIEYVNHPNFHGCWDTGHAALEGYKYPYPTDRLTQEKMLYLITEHILKSYDMLYQE